MSEEPVMPVQPQMGRTYTWSEAWIAAVTKPAMATYESLVADPKASTTRAFLWIVIASLIGSLISTVGQSIFGKSMFSTLFNQQQSSFSQGGGVAAFICGVPIAAVFAVIGLVIVAGAAHLIAKALGGSGTYRQVLYVYAAIQAPLALVTGILGAIPVVGCLNVLVAIYMLVLIVIALKAVHKIDTGKAILAALALPVLLIILAIVVGIIAAVIAGPIIGNIFQNLMRGISTP